MQTSSTALTFMERGFPHATLPIGWFQIAWSAELQAQGVLPLHFFDTDLVLYRTESGEAVTLDAICPHMGANMAFNGTVSNDCLTCPYHGWTWRQDGTLDNVPYSENRPRVKATAWPTAEKSGIVYVWHHPDGGEPTWSPPDIAEDEDEGFHRPYPYGSHSDSINAHPQFLVENFPDLVHMKYVHEWLEIPAIEALDLSGPIAINSYKGLIGTPKGPVEVHNTGHAFGVGINLARIVGPITSATLGCFTPIDQTRSMGFVSVWVPRQGNEGRPAGFGAAIIRENIEQLFGDRHDRPIAEHLSYKAKPLLLPEEAKLHRDFRHWCKQFYVD